MHATFKQKLVTNVVSQIGLTVLFPALSFITALIISRYLGKASLGEYDIASNYFNIFRDIALLGLPALMIKKLSQSNEADGTYLSNALFIAAIAALVSILSLNLLNLGLHYPPRLALIILLFSLLILPDVFICFLSSGYTARNRVPLFSSVFMPLVVLQFGIYSVLLMTGADLYMVVVVTVIVHSVNCTALFWMIRRKLFRVSLRQVRLPVVKELLASIPVFALLFIIEMLLFRVDVTILSKHFSSAELACYSVAKRFIFFVYLISAALANAIFPLLSHRHANQTGTQGVEERNFLRFLTIAGIFVSVNLWLAAPVVITTLFGSQYAAAAEILRIMALAGVPLFISTFASKAIIVYNRQKSDLLILGLTLAATPVIYLLGINLKGLAGGAWAFTASFTFLAIARLGLMQLSKSAPLGLRLPAVLQFGLIGLAVSSLIFFTPQLALAYRLSIVNLTCLGLLLMFRMISLQQLAFIREMLKSRRLKPDG